MSHALSRQNAADFPIESQQVWMDKVRALDAYNGASYRIVTYGCQMNEHDSEKLAGMLQSMGFIPCDEEDKADILLYNTCCIRDNAERRVYGNISALRPLKQERPHMVIGVCGCMMQQGETADKLLQRYPFVDMVFGTHNLHTFPEMLYSVLSERHRVCDIWDVDGTVVEGVPMVRKRGVLAWQTIMYGCDNYCTYCVVPYTRGRERSRESGAIIREAKELAAGGFKEITLLGQNVNSYGVANGDMSFPELLRRLNDIEGLERIRFMTSHPKDLSHDLMHAMHQCEHVCKQLHLPLQSGNDAILQQMNRAYTTGAYVRIVDELRSLMPNIGLSTDIIVGFPGEDEHQFEDTMRFVERLRFHSIYAFAYSPRRGTAAANMDNHVPRDIQNERLRRLLAMQERISADIAAGYVGKTMPVLIEKMSKRSDRQVSGKTDCGKTVNMPGDASSIGQVVPVLITEAASNTLKGKRIGKNEKE